MKLVTRCSGANQTFLRELMKTLRLQYLLEHIAASIVGLHWVDSTEMFYNCNPALCDKTQMIIAKLH